MKNAVLIILGAIFLVGAAYIGFGPGFLTAPSQTAVPYEETEQNVNNVEKNESGKIPETGNPYSYPYPYPSPKVSDRDLPQCGTLNCFVYEPVCGSDGKTYACGEEDARSCGVEVVHGGEC